MDAFSTALVFAARVHQGQRRKGSDIPYVAHVLGVAALALEYGATEDEAIAALLHDAAEDAGGEAMLAEIRAQFGEKVADIVLGCSDSLVEDPAEKRLGMPGGGRRQAAQRPHPDPYPAGARRGRLEPLQRRPGRFPVVLRRGFARLMAALAVGTDRRAQARGSGTARTLRVVMSPFIED